MCQVKRLFKCLSGQFPATGSDYEHLSYLSTHPFVLINPVVIRLISVLIGLHDVIKGILISPSPFSF